MICTTWVLYLYSCGRDFVIQLNKTSIFFTQDVRVNCWQKVDDADFEIYEDIHGENYTKGHE